MSVDKVCNCIKLCVFLSIYVDVDICRYVKLRRYLLIALTDLFSEIWLVVKVVTRCPTQYVYRSGPASVFTI